MKGEEFKEALKKDFLKQAPDGFTDKLMLRIENNKTLQEHLLPRGVLFFIFGASAVLILVIMSVLYKEEQFQLPLDTYLYYYYQISPMLILPLCMAVLYFLKELFHYRKTQKLRNLV